MKDEAGKDEGTDGGHEETRHQKSEARMQIEGPEEGAGKREKVVRNP
jgi:hypothetical protein